MFLAIDIGDTHTRIGVGEKEFSTIRKHNTENFLEKHSDLIQEAVNDAGTSVKNIDRAAVAAAGPIDREKGVFHPPNLPVDSFNLEEELDYGELSIVNDATAGAAGEYFYGESDSENMIYLTISTGIGAGVVADGEILEGWHGNLGEVGHMKIADRGVKCGCGGVDHWEAYSSGHDLPRMAEELFDADFSDAKEIFAEARKGNSRAEKTLVKMQEANSRGLANIINLYNPEILWTGGPVALNHFQKAVEEPMKKAVEETVNQEPEVRKNSLGEEAVLYGLRAVLNGKYSPGN